MQLTTDGDFIAKQQALVGALLVAIKEELERVDAPTDLVTELTGSIAFRITSLLDGASSAEHDGEELNPMLAFQVSDSELLWPGGNTWMHEYVYRLLPTLAPSE